MADRDHQQGEQEFTEERASLFRISIAPLIWAVHFLASYASTAVYCAKLLPTLEGMDLLRWAIAAATLVALGGIAWTGWRAWVHWQTDNNEWEDSSPSNEDRHQFLGHAAFLLSIISFIGVIYTALPALLSPSCL